ncbi:anti-sigma-V factor rsiV [Bacillus sp. FJAT-22090]|uniref:DUF3298 and DUF4163 domain-containing protein n=1 Tax=Bacillus sp. FJAT-22090 TaxID=1581038 RepID=UPI0011A2B7D0|nr:anti-sigma-V factor rsiV [Bacillus sp. FJAT-22090]
MKKLQDAKRKYEEVEIPEELNNIVKNSIKEAKRNQKKQKPVKRWGIGLVAAAALFTASVNVSPALAQSLSTVPLLGSIVQVVTFQAIELDEDTYNADLQTPNVTGLDNKKLENMLNEKYIEENEALYEGFLKDMEELKAEGGGHLGLSSTYEVVTDTDEILSISRYEVNTVASSSTTMRTDTIDKKNQILISLPSLFKDDSYIKIISDYITEEMKRQMKEDENIIYWVGDDVEVEPFDKIRPDQTFSITEDHKLTISFDKYEVAPGYMGVITFEIPTELLNPVLISDYYIK